jgi:hypothetical protein
MNPNQTCEHFSSEKKKKKISNFRTFAFGFKCYDTYKHNMKVVVCKLLLKKNPIVLHTKHFVQD